MEIVYSGKSSVRHNADVLIAMVSPAGASKRLVYHSNGKVHLLASCAVGPLVGRLAIQHQGEKIMKIGFVHFTVLLMLCFLLVSCGPAPRKDARYIPSASASGSRTPVSRTSPASASTSLPRTAEVDLVRLPLLKTIFRNQPASSRIDDLFARAKGQVDNLSLISNCDLDILKGFVAAGWTPVVLLRSGRQPWVLVGYDDAVEQVQLTNIANAPSRTTDPKRLTLRREGYSDFGREWASGKCMLVAPGLAFTEIKVRSVLAKYLTATQASQVKVRSR